MEAGAKGVTLVDLHKGNLAKAHAELEKQYSGRVLAVAGDVATEAATEEYVGETLKKWGYLDVSRCIAVSVLLWLIRPFLFRCRFRMQESRKLCQPC